MSNFSYEIKIPKDRIAVIYNPYDIDSIVESSQQQIDDDVRHIFEKDVIINVGRLEKQKGQDMLIRVFCQARRDGLDAELVIIGEDLGMGEYLKELAKNSGMGEHIHFLCFREN